MNNKGFMMAEVIVVSSIIVVFLASLYLSYNKLFSLYKTRISYYDSVTLYRLAYYRDLLIEEDKMNALLTAAKSVAKNVFDSAYISGAQLNDGDTDKVYMVYNNRQKISSNALSSFTLNPTFIDYMEYISTAGDATKFNYVLVMERCKNKANPNDEDKCYYAYLEVYDGQEP